MISHRALPRAVVAAEGCPPEARDFRSTLVPVGDAKPGGLSLGEPETR